MNCEEYRQAISADPQFDGGAGHVAECADCRAYRSEVVDLDAKIRAALAIDVPPLEMPELPAVDTSGVVRFGSRRQAAAGWFALAATVVLAAFVGFRLLGPGVQYDSLADEVLAHVDHEPWSMRVTDEPVADTQLENVAGTVARFGTDAPLVTYAHTCVIDGHEVPHLVVQGETGPVMILLMPDEKVDGPIPLEDEDNRGVILPVGEGSIAIVGSRAESVEKLEKRILNSVTWTI